MVLFSGRELQYALGSLGSVLCAKELNVAKYKLVISKQATILHFKTVRKSD